MWRRPSCRILWQLCLKLGHLSYRTVLGTAVLCRHCPQPRSQGGNEHLYLTLHSSRLCGPGPRSPQGIMYFRGQHKSPIEHQLNWSSEEEPSSKGIQWLVVHCWGERISFSTRWPIVSLAVCLPHCNVSCGIIFLVAGTEYPAKAT